MQGYEVNAEFYNTAPDMSIYSEGKCQSLDPRDGFFIDLVIQLSSRLEVRTIPGHISRLTSMPALRIVSIKPVSPQVQGIEFFLTL